MFYRARIARALAIGVVFFTCAATAFAGYPDDHSRGHPNPKLTISGSPPTSVVADASYSFTPTVSGRADENLTFSISNKPSWASFSATTGELSGTPAASNVGTFSAIVISAQNQYASASLTPFSIQVTAAASTSAPPTISGSPATSVTAGSAYSFQPTASGPTGAALSFSVENMPAWASFSIATGLLSGTPTSAQVGAYSGIVVSVSDGTASAALPAFSISVNAAATPPPQTGSATLTWAAPTTNTNGTSLTDLAGYYVYYGASASSLSQSVQLTSPSQTSYTVSGLSAGTWYFAVAAYASDGTQSAQTSVESATVQ